MRVRRCSLAERREEKRDKPSGTSSTFLTTGRETITGFWRCSVPLRVCFLVQRTLSAPIRPWNDKGHSQGRKILLREAISFVSPIVQPEAVDVVALDSPQPRLAVLGGAEARSKHLPRRRWGRKAVESGDGSSSVLATEVGDVDPDVWRRRGGAGDCWGRWSGGGRSLVEDELADLAVLAKVVVRAKGSELLQGKERKRQEARRRSG